MQLQRPGDSPDGGGGGQDPRPLDRPKPGDVLPTPDSIQEANEEQVGGQLLNAAQDEGPALGAPQLLLGFQDPLQTGLAERVLARQHLCCGIELFEAHGTLQQVKESQVIHLQRRAPSGAESGPSTPHIHRRRLPAAARSRSWAQAALLHGGRGGGSTEQSCAAGV